MRNVAPGSRSGQVASSGLLKALSLKAAACFVWICADESSETEPKYSSFGGPEKKLNEAKPLGTARDEMQNQMISLASHEIVFSIVNLKINICAA